MEEKKTELVESDLSGIQPFSGTPIEMAPQILSEGKALQKVETKYTTAIAVQKPRSITRLLSNVLEEARMAGASFYYGWVVKSKDGPVRIEGPSIDLAMCVARHYGNCALDIEASETPTHYMMKGYLIDLESGFTCPRLFRQRKSQSMGEKMDKDRQEDIVFQIGQSKAIRNAIVRAMPRWLMDRAIEAAKDAEIKNIKEEGPVVAQAKVLGFFKEYGISQERIEKQLKKVADDWSAYDIADLRANAIALKEGRIRADELFPGEEEKAETKEPEKKEATKEKKEKSPWKGLGDKNFRIFVELHANEIPDSSQEDQDEIRKSWKKRFNEPYPVDKEKDSLSELHGHLAQGSKDVPSNSVNSYGEGMQSEPDVTEGDPGAETPTEKILRLVTGAKFDDTLDQPSIPCPQRQNKPPIPSNWCLQSCNDRGECKPWADYNSEDTE